MGRLTRAATLGLVSPYRQNLIMGMRERADIGDRDLKQAIVHSHLSSPPRPSRTDVENIGQWEGQPYFIYSLREDDLAGWTISDGQIAPLAVTL